MKYFFFYLITNNILEHREEYESQCDYSTTITAHTVTSTTTDNDSQTKKHRVSIGPTTVATATIENHFNRDEFPSVPKRRIPSPILSTTSSDTEIEGNIINRTRSTTPTPSPTLNQT